MNACLARDQPSARTTGVHMADARRTGRPAPRATNRTHLGRMTLSLVAKEPAVQPYERIQSVLDRRPTDRPPVDLWCTPEVLDSLRAYTGKSDELDVYQALGVDKIVWVFPGYAGRKFDPNDSEGEVTPWGVPTRKMKAGLATYEEYASHPFADFTDVRELDDYELWPDPDRFDYAEAIALAKRARDYGFGVIGPWVSHFEVYCSLRGLENSLMDTLADEDFLEAALDRIDAIQTRMIDRLLTEAGDLIDLVFISDDMAMQQNLLVTPQTWQTHFRPRLAAWCDLVHSHGVKAFYHTDGAAYPLIGGLVDCGIDVLNPIQHACPGMETDRLQAEFGDRIVFHGGIENQQILPKGTPDDVARETRECLETLGKDGGYIVCSCHNAQAGTPVENILAMINTTKEWQG